ncbi:group II intron reverse transcriptase/maturase [Paenibacillus sp. UMB7766-LJ446]|uniref:group II intron reverse transcriptase/maturase n=1 Tax=unclassified Paenibacillus TaxID=185978 RepID=UPI00254E0050|nr:MULTISPECIES: group II intron reverse transcriptase/maturase [unclassified Paenibacillus]MDK8194907.1 group II intron reverse transcriptase/maturase [Paenibacillus sp. UMB7766-LJ446]MDN8587530.1 group II intron reverse transcriptase/maturase [Paenibacillus sp. 11B]MDN8593254.1 group II intron reverse transcriptase/maturase [Paenibacillus sp. 11B]
MQTLRYWDYYDMTSTFTDLHEKALGRKKFDNLYGLINSHQNILLAFRTIKSNKGSLTPGTDGKTIENIKTLTEEEIVSHVRNKLLNYQPKKVRRVLIPKPNGKKRPLGIPCIVDRIIQQCFKQIIEPIAEAYFYKHSYGFRPVRSTHNALARVQHLINTTNLHYVVDVDIQGFFDNVNHTLLLKQLWNMGIRDKRVLRIISKMLKAEIEDEGIPLKGTPQGGILSPLLSNVVLNDLDQWVAGQWTNFETQYAYAGDYHRIRALKKTNLKEGYIVRYADDFKILCRDWKSAQKWYHAVRLYLRDRLKLDISPEKSQIVNLRKRKSDFLGFTIWAEKKGKRRVAYTGINEKKRAEIKKQARERIKNLHKAPITQNALLFNSFVLGLHNYFSRATHVSVEFSRLAFDLKAFTYNRLKVIGKYQYPDNAPPTFKKFYRNRYRTFKVAGVYLFPFRDVKTVNNLCFQQTLNPYTSEGRKRLHRDLKTDIRYELIKLMQSNIPNRSIEYLDNRLSRYSMQGGKCEISGILLTADYVHCHHLLPIHLGGTDDFSNLRILHKDIHKLVHATKSETIVKLMSPFGFSDSTIQKINLYRKMSNLEPIVIKI